MIKVGRRENGDEFGQRSKLKRRRIGQEGDTQWVRRFSSVFFSLFCLFFSVACFSVSSSHQNPKNLPQQKGQPYPFSDLEKSLPFKAQPRNSQKREKFSLVSSYVDDRKGEQEDVDVPLDPLFSESDTFFLEAQSDFKGSNFHMAYQKFLFVARSSHKKSSRREEAYLGALHSLQKLELNKKALDLTEEALNFQGLSQKGRREFYRLRFFLLSELSYYMEALYLAQFLLNSTQEEREKNFYQSKSLSYLQLSLKKEDLKQVIRSYRLKSLHSHAYFRLASIYMEEQDLRRAKRAFEKVLRLEPSGSLARQASKWIQRIKDQKTVQPYKIGVILPLSGQYSKLSQKVLNGLLLGLGIHGEAKESPFHLILMDSLESPDVAAQAVERLFSENNVIAIVGSLLSRTAESVAKKANELGIPCLSLSQKPRLTELGDYVFRNSLTSKIEIHHLVKILIQKKGLKRFSILFPNDNYGVEYTNLFWDEVKQLGGHIVGAQTYRTGETDFKNFIERLVGLYYIEDREEEFRDLVHKWMKKNKRVSRRREPPSDLLSPVVGFEALFIPDGTKTIGQVAPMLDYYEIENVILVGTNLWNGASLVKRGGKHVEGALFLDSPSEFKRTSEGRGFLKNYRWVFEEDPNVFSARSYDVAKILRFLIEEEGERTRIGLKEELTGLRGFRGLFGPLYMMKTREISQHMKLFTVRRGRILPLEF